MVGLEQVDGDGGVRGPDAILNGDSVYLTTYAAIHLSVRSAHRRRIYTEEKAKVVAAVWGTELIQFLATLQIYRQDYL